MNRRSFLGTLVALAVAPTVKANDAPILAPDWKFRNPYYCGYLDQVSPGARKLHAEWKRRVASGEIAPFGGFNNIKW